MNSNNWQYFIPLILSLTVTSALCIYSWNRRETPGAGALATGMLAEASWIFGYILELASPTLQAKIFWDDFQFIGSLALPLSLLVFILEYTGYKPERFRQWINLLAILPILFLLLLFTNPWHGMVRSSAWIVPGRPFDTLLYDFSLPMWLSFLYSYAAYLTGTILLVQNLFNQHGIYRIQTTLIIVGFLFPFLGSLPGLLGITIAGQRDITPLTFAIANMFLAWGVFRHGLFDIAPIARDAVIENMDDAVIVLDSNLRIVDINPSALSGLSIDRDKLYGMPISNLLTSQPDLIKKFQQENPVREEVTYSSKNGKEFCFDAYISPLRDQHGKLIGRLLVARDVTEQKQMELELRKAYEELELRVQERTRELESANKELEEKNTELERFTYTVSHDLKSPLITIRGYLGYLEEDARSGNLERLHEDIQRITKAANTMHQLLNELLELSRIGRLLNEPERVSFEELVNETLGLLHGPIKTRGVTVMLHPGLPTVYGDRSRLIEVLQNLVDNAIKFMGDQATPRIEIGHLGEENSKPIFYVKDNGIGISPEHHERIFGLFNKLDPSIDGTGIGLALVKRIIEFHSGRIWVESEAGAGASFLFTLPTISGPPGSKT